MCFPERTNSHQSKYRELPRVTIATRRRAATGGATGAIALNANADNQISTLRAPTGGQPGLSPAWRRSRPKPALRRSPKDPAHSDNTATLPECANLSARSRRPALRLFASLACAALAACETTAPTEPIKPAEVVVETAAPIAAEEHSEMSLVERANRLIDDSCPQPENRLCPVQTLASLVAAIAGTEAPAATTNEPTRTSSARTKQSERQALHDRLWRLTGAFAQGEVGALAQQQPLLPLWQLRAALSAARSSQAQAGALRAWMARWPAHPFCNLLPTGLARLSATATQPARVGLFVPLSGALSAAGRAVRDGYIAAWLDDPAPNKAPLTVYDTAKRPLAEILKQSLAHGVQLIVGPLSKQRLEALRRLNPEVAVLGLNYLDTATTDNAAPHPSFLQVGLAIEDEATTIAERLQAEGLHRLLAVRGGEDWADRGVQALVEAWADTVEVHPFTDVKTLTESIGGAMQIAASTQRKEALEALLNTRLEFLPRRRSDIDAVVAFVDHIEASALAPALKFHFAGDLPVFASSLSVRNATGLGELNGFQVAEIPLNLYPNPLWDTVKTVFDKRDGNIAALHALGMDAYRIAALADWVARGEPVYGATGELRLGDGGQVRRTLHWASVSRGIIRPTPTAQPVNRL